jgi:hypothetical protein
MSAEKPSILVTGGAGYIWLSYSFSTQASRL